MPMQVFESVPSTMDIARKNVVAGRLQFDADGRCAYEGVLARAQTAGRGQQGRTWYAPPGESLCATYYFRSRPTGPQYAAEIALLAAIAVAEAVQHRIDAAYPLEAQAEQRMRVRPSVGLKWPNDVLLNDKKVAGILIEMVKAPDGEWVALIGVGLNVAVRVFPSELAPHVTSLLLEGVDSVGWDELAMPIAAALRAQAARRRAGGLEAILTAWRTYDRTPGRRFQTTMDGAVLIGTVEGVNEEGALRLRLEDGRAIAVHTASSLREVLPAPSS